ncbi:MAG: lysozyme inhibitor LprI family protein [Luteibacter sp.]
MHMVKTLAASIAFLAFTLSASAAESTSQVIRSQAPKGINASFYACIDKAGSDTGSLGTCINAEKQRQDTRLNTTYKALTAKLTGKAKDNLVAAERDWLDLQKASSLFEASLYPDETVADLQVAQSEVFRLCERANALDKYLTIANDL